MKEKTDKSYMRELITSVLGVFILIVLIFGISYAVEVSDGNEKINTLTMGYLSFNFIEGNNNTINVVSSKPMNDSLGKDINDKDKYYEFSVSNDFDKEINYEILLEPIINTLDGKYIKFYLTDENNKPLSGFDKEVPVFSQFSDSELDGNKVLYKDTLKAKSDSKFILRVWISDSYNVSKESDLSFSFKVDVKGTV